jgi:aspartyl-tRNA(Asn)/glutamyl-tRNA(Gln) amidotransferase subunit C
MGEGGKGLNVDAIAAIARIAVDEEEEKMLTDQLGRIVSYVGRMKELDLEGVEPFFCALPVDSVLAEDRADVSFPPETILANAPQRKDGQIAVPRVVEGQ